jgi:hypothetical protein
MELVDWLRLAMAGDATEADAADHLAPHVVEQVGVTTVLGGLLKVSNGRSVRAIEPGPVDGQLLIRFDDNAYECHLDEDGKVLGLNPAPDGVEIATWRAAVLPTDTREALHALFAVAYDDADGDYLDRSLEKLGFVAIATDATDGHLVGFALGDRRTLDLPMGIGPTPVLLAGLACIDPARRRQGLFRYLSNLAIRAAGRIPDRNIGAGRMAHPASMRMVRLVPSVVPRRGLRPNDLHRAVGAAVAAAYGVADFDPDTFVCHGAGRAIGTARLTQEVEPEEWELFEPVDRRRGDSLLAVYWNGGAPAGW